MAAAALAAPVTVAEGGGGKLLVLGGDLNWGTPSGAFAPAAAARCDRRYSRSLSQCRP